MDKNDWKLQTNPAVRCPPIVYADQKNNKIMTTDEVRTALEDAYNTGGSFSCPHGEIDMPPYAKKVEPGFCDWCSGKNMHFDIMYRRVCAKESTSDNFDVDFENGVVKYTKIACPT